MSVPLLSRPCPSWASLLLYCRVLDPWPFAFSVSKSDVAASSRQIASEIGHGRDGGDFISSRKTSEGECTIRCAVAADADLLGLFLILIDSALALLATRKTPGARNWIGLGRSYSSPRYCFGIAGVTGIIRFKFIRCENSRVPADVESETSTQRMCF